MAYEEVCLKRHVLILDWTDKGVEIIDNLHSPDVRDPRQIVIVSDKKVSVDPGRQESRGVVVVPGDAADSDVLRMANAERASAAIVLADECAESEAVTRALMVVLALRSLSPEIYVVVEVQEESQRCHFDALGDAVDEVVCPGEYISKMLAQGAVFPDSGLVDFYSHLLDQGEDSNEIYLLDVPTDLRGRKWLEARRWLIEHADQRVIPIGYVCGRRVTEESLVLSPGAHGDSELQRPFDAEDRVVLIAPAQPRLDRS